MPRANRILPTSAFLAACLLVSCNESGPSGVSAWDQLTVYQRTAIKICNDSGSRIRALQRFAERAKSRELYEALAAPIVEQAVSAHRAENRSSTFQDFLEEFTAAEAAFVWENRRATGSRLDREHLRWCGAQDDWISSYR